MILSSPKSAPRTLCIATANMPMQCHELVFTSILMETKRSRTTRPSPSRVELGIGKTAWQISSDRDEIELQSLEIVSKIFDVSCESLSDNLLELRCIVAAVMPVDRNVGMRDSP